MHVQCDVNAGVGVRRAERLSAVHCAFTYNIKASLERRMNSETQIATVGDVRHNADWIDKAIAGAINWIV